MTTTMAGMSLTEVKEAIGDVIQVVTAVDDTVVDYSKRVGWGHSSLRHAVLFAAQMDVRRLMTSHHDPEHTDDMLDAQHARSAGPERVGSGGPAWHRRIEL